MCLIAFAWRVHPRYPLIVAANRDEFHDRPTASAAPWPEDGSVIGGRDLRDGGSWLALRRGGRLAAVTNVRAAKAERGQRSRGHLVRDFVRGNELAAAFAEDAWVAWERYAGFNLLLHDGEELIWVSNRPKPAWKSVAPGVHGVSNGSPSFVAGRPPWPKVLLAMAGLSEWVRALPAEGEPDPSLLFAMLADERTAADNALPDTGVGLETERLLSPAFIRGAGYGTRSSSVALVGNDGSAVLFERRFEAGGRVGGDVRLTLPPA